MKQLVDLIHSHGCPTFLQMEHDGPWQNPLFPNHPATYDGPPIGASAREHRQAERLPPRHDPAARRSPRSRRSPASTSTPPSGRRRPASTGSTSTWAAPTSRMNFMSPVVEPARRRVRGHARRSGPSWLLDIVSGIKKRCGDDFPIVVCVNGFETGYLLGEPDDKVFNHDLALKTMGWLVDAGADALMIRSSWLGLHVPGLPARLPVLPRGPGAGGQDAAPVLLEGPGQGRHPADDRGGQEEVRRAHHPHRLRDPRAGRADAGRGQGRLHRHEPAAHRRRRPAEQAQGRASRDWWRPAPAAAPASTRASRSCATAASTPRWATACTACPRPTRRRKWWSWAAARPAWRRPGWRLCAATT